MSRASTPWEEIRAQLLANPKVKAAYEALGRKHMRIALELIKDSPRPIRTSWDEDALNELAKSIAEQGVIVPIKVRPANDAARLMADYWPADPDDEINAEMAIEEGHGRPEYEIVYGHRRVEAARRACLTEIDAVVEGVDDTAALVQALIENVQREDMEPMDKARALKTLIDETGWSQSEIARRGVMAADSVADYIALLRLPDDIRAAVARAEDGRTPPNTITQYHAKQVRRAGVSDDVGADALRKAAYEGLTAAQTRAVAETAAKTQDPERRKALLATPYNPFTHNPEYAEMNERADRITAPTAQERFDSTPEVAIVLEQIKKLREAMRLSAEAVEMGKASPEARRFIGRRMIDLGQELIKRGEALSS